MTATSTYFLEELIKISIDPNTALLTCASFEARSSVIANALSSSSISYTIIFNTVDYQSIITEKADELCSIAPGIKWRFNMELYAPVVSKMRITDAIRKLMAVGVSNLLIDITTFTHELLLMLLHVVFVNKSFFTSVRLLYLGASHYGGISIDDVASNYRDIWLSKGCRDVRSVVGYPGVMIPNKNTHLIVLCGFEYERASAMISDIAPDYLSLGSGLPGTLHTTSEAHDMPMKYFFELTYDWAIKRMSKSRVNKFFFSSKDPNLTAANVSVELSKQNTMNNIIIPLNTKVSTMAVAIVGLKNRSAQVCYALPDDYNIWQYADPGNEASIYDIPFFTSKS